MRKLIGRVSEGRGKPSRYNDGVSMGLCCGDWIGARHDPYSPCPPVLPCAFGQGQALSLRIPTALRALVLVVLLVTFCLLIIASPVLAASHADGNGQISGQLLNGTNSNAPLPGQSVTLQMAQGSN